ncbi:hypothetical protein [Aliidiomarina quisquiliarum]|uniref:hypothetical protein n=1 Tax=Aliidiomarina quisquiliarum TaxID=2938947 RepID=UPI00208E23C8|nr:hypothetical protein [Aliidiomarina quisquiliarum]MCO4322480.1 hypothetical protein [Aliidiomarina quisquiliarum]
MKNLYLKFDQFFKARVERERWLLSIVLVSMLSWLSWLLVIEPAKLSYEQLIVDHTTLQSETEKLAVEIQNIELQLAQDPNALLRERYQRSVERRDQLGRLLDEKAEFTQPEQLLGWIQALLEPGTGLTLEALSALPLAFYWQGLDYQVMEHPKAHITLELFTLSYSAANDET